MNTILHRAAHTTNHSARAPGRAFASIALAMGLAGTGCAPEEPTEIVAGVSTQINVPDHLRAVGVVVQVAGRVVFCENYPVIEGAATLPATLGVLGESGLSARGTVTVQILGLRDEESAFAEDCLLSRPESIDEAFVIRRRRLTFVDDHIKFLPLPLKESCAEKKDCSEDETCVGGKCVDMDIDVRSLPDYSDGLIFGDTNTCFDGNRCMPGGLSVPVMLEDAETCTFRALWPDSAPRPEPGALNVRLYYRSFGSEILDLDASSLETDQREGFSFMDEDEPLVFQLAPNLCETNYQLDKVLAMDASALCPTKRALQPLCDDYEAPDPRGDAGNGGNGGNAEPGLCAIAGLEPVESAIYVLMDRSASMSKFFGDGGLRFAVELPLSSPVARRTKVGFELLPAEAEQCGTNAYEAPMIPFGGVEAARGPIAELLQAGDVLLDDNPSQFFLEAALQGAYAGVRAVRANDESRGFNRRAVVVVSNRDLSAGACPGPTALELAADALEGDRIFTYAVALDDGEDGALDSAFDLANAGGTRVFDGVTDEAEGARAVNDILTELGTCLYTVTGNDEPLPAGASISYLDPSRPSRSGVDIPHNPLCEEGAVESVSGWNQESGTAAAPGVVRLCGQACEDLREVIGDVGILHASQGRVPPAVPLVVTAPCRE